MIFVKLNVKLTHEEALRKKNNKVTDTMSNTLKLILMILMTTALLFGFLHLFVPGRTFYNFERLHIFFFNLCSGGTILLYYTEKKDKMTIKTALFLALAVTYALLSYFKIYPPAIIIAFILSGLVESVRIKKFSVFPLDFFKSRILVSAKFHQAALLCLSIGLLISGLVILNNEYLKILSYPKLQLNTFFLGFSFPLSLITMSVMFSFMEGDFGRPVLYLENIGFWTVNLGVIIFFLFILLEMLIPQIMVTTILFCSVIMIYYLFSRFGVKTQQKNFLTSGMLFLLYTAITGIAYIAFEFSPDYSPEKTKLLLRMHSFASLYGWNLSGLAVICREHDFPIKLHSRTIIIVHWITAILLAPLGTYFRFFAVCALICYMFILYMMLFSAREPGIITH